MKVVQFLEYSGVLIKDTVQTIKNESKIIKRWIS